LEPVHTNIIFRLMLKDKLFPNQKADEKVLLLLRRHWTVALALIIKYSLLLLAPMLLVAIEELFTPGLMARLDQGIFSHPLTIMVLSLYYLFVWIFFFHAWIDYYLDVWIVTNERVVNIEQKGLFSRSVSEIKLFRVQDVKAEVHGMIPTIFHYGEVTIQTAGSEIFAIFKEVPNPYEISRQVSKLVERNKKLHQHDLEPHQLEAKPEKNETKTV